MTIINGLIQLMCILNKLCLDRSIRSSPNKNNKESPTMNVLLNAFLQGLLVGAIIASVTVVVYLLYIKLKSYKKPKMLSHK
jgi:Na+/H+ antiporter NhaB